MKKPEEIWEAACKAQMNAVLEHCQHSPEGTNGHAIKHWVKTPKMPEEYSDNSDQKYTIEDIKKAFQEAREEVSYCGMGGWKTECKWDLDEYIASLNK